MAHSGHPRRLREVVRSRAVGVVLRRHRPPALDGAAMTLLRRITPVVHRIDHAIGRLSPRRDVLVEMRTPVYHAVLGPIADALARLRQGSGGQAASDVHVWYTSEAPDRVKHLVPE